MIKSDNYWRYQQAQLFKLKIMKLRLKYDFRFKRMRELEKEFDLDCNLLQKQHHHSSKELIQHDIDLYDLVIRHSDLLK
jgi:hypothetical protein|tara:strand:+ start:1405 stop:1641 length:237 start_codon:yes stop_codon:yes gene_type:complete